MSDYIRKRDELIKNNKCEEWISSHLLELRWMDIVLLTDHSDGERIDRIHIRFPWAVVDQ